MASMLILSMMARGWMALGAAALLLAGGLVGFLVDSPAQAKVPVDQPTVDAAVDCPELSSFDDAFTSMSTAELEHELVHRGLIAPSFAQQQLAAIDGALAAYTAHKRACMRRVMLIQSVASQRSMKGPGGRLWYFGHDSDHLQKRLLEGELTTQWTQAQRRRAVAWIEDGVLPHLSARDEADRDHWRRMYYGIALARYASDAELARLGGVREAHNAFSLEHAVAAPRQVAPIVPSDPVVASPQTRHPPRARRSRRPLIRLPRVNRPRADTLPPQATPHKRPTDKPRPRDIEPPPLTLPNLDTF